MTPSHRKEKENLLSFLAEVLLLAATFPLYTLVHALVKGRISEAEANASSIVSLERGLGIYWELEVQHFFLSIDFLIEIANFVYVYAHLPLISIIAVWLFWRKRSTYLLLRNAFLLSGAISLIIYASFPVAPPRLMNELGFVDTVFEEFDASRPFTPSFLMNQYAAMPSLHFGWNILLGLGVWNGLSPSLSRTIGGLLPLPMLVAIVATGNHYLLDAAMGAVVVTAGLSLAIALRGRLGQPPMGPRGRYRQTLRWLAAGSEQLIGSEARGLVSSAAQAAGTDLVASSGTVESAQTTRTSVVVHRPRARP